MATAAGIKGIICTFYLNVVGYKVRHGGSANAKKKAGFI